MKCSNCGTEFEGSFCPECGTKEGIDKSKEETNPDKVYNKCKNCGTTYEGFFCPECGAKTGDASPAKTSDIAGAPLPGKKMRPAAASDKKTLALIIVIVCAVLAMAATAVLWIVKNNNTVNSDNTSVQSTSTGKSSISDTQTAQGNNTAANSATVSQPVQSTPSATEYVQEQGAADVEENSQSYGISLNGSAEDYLKEYRLDHEQFTEEDTYSLEQTELRMLINALYAYHGYTFETDDYKRLFSRMEWYTPQEKTMEECEAEFNSIERANKDVFIAREKAMGWR